jgi:hypothetical protein
VCEIFLDVNNPTRDKLVHKNVMAKVLGDTNHGTSSQGDSCSFPFFGNVGAPLMATLNIHGLNVGLIFWLWVTLNVLNALDVSQIRTLFHGHPLDVNPLPLSTNYTYPPSPCYGEVPTTSKQKSKMNRKRNSKNKKSPTSASHIGDVPPTSTSHVGVRSPASANHARGMQPTTASQVGSTKPSPSSHVGFMSTKFAIHVDNKKPDATSHVGAKQPDYVNHVGSAILVTTIHDRIKSPASSSHVGGKKLASVIHARSKKPTSASHVGVMSTTSTSHVED